MTGVECPRNLGAPEGDVPNQSSYAVGWSWGWPGSWSFGLGKDKQGGTGWGSNVFIKRDIQEADKGGDLFPARASMLGVVLT